MDAGTTYQLFHNPAYAPWFRYFVLCVFAVSLLCSVAKVGHDVRLYLDVRRTGLPLHTAERCVMPFVSFTRCSLRSVVLLQRCAGF